MGRAPCCSKVGLRRGPWSTKEDTLLTQYVQTQGEGQWRSMPKKAGLLRCGKSCRLRWMNYLRPGIKRGNITADEEDLIIRLHKLLGNRWSLIAGRLPGRTDNEIKNHWNTHLHKRAQKPKNSATGKKVSKNVKITYPVNETHAAGVESVVQKSKNPDGKKKQKQNNSSSSSKVTHEITAANEFSVPESKKLSVSTSYSFSNSYSFDDRVAGSSSSHEEIDNTGISDLHWPWLELEDPGNGGGIQMCSQDILISGCDLSIQTWIPTTVDMLDKVYDEYLQLL